VDQPITVLNHTSKRRRCFAAFDLLWSDYARLFH
jgi:hypothetical protein